MNAAENHSKISIFHGLCDGWMEQKGILSTMTRKKILNLESQDQDLSPRQSHQIISRKAVGCLWPSVITSPTVTTVSVSRRECFMSSFQALRLYLHGWDLVGCGSHRIHRELVGEDTRRSRGHHEGLVQEASWGRAIVSLGAKMKA